MRIPYLLGEVEMKVLNDEVNDEIWFVPVSYGDFSYNKGFYDNLIYYGSYIVIGYFTLFSIEHLMDYFKKNLQKSILSRY